MKFRHLVINFKFLIFVLLLTVTYAAKGQNSNLLDSGSSGKTGNSGIRTSADRQIDYMQRLYSEKVEDPKEFINGKEYESYYTRSQSKPILFVDKRRTAALFTKSRRYNNLTLQYDTFLDEVIFTDISKTINSRFPQIALNRDNVEGFNLYFDDDSLIFRQFRSPECRKKNLSEGFYEIAFQGGSTYIIRHKSSFYVREGRNEYKYSPENYISTGEVFHRIKSKSDLLKLFVGKSAEIKKYLHLARIRIKQADKQQFVEILKYYDSLKTAAR